MFRVVVIILDVFSHILGSQNTKYILQNPGMCYFWEKKRPLPGSLDTVVRASVHGMSGVFVIILYVCSYILVPKTPKYILQNLGTCCFWKKAPARQPRHRRLYVFSPKSQMPDSQKCFSPFVVGGTSNPSHILFNLIQIDPWCLLCQGLGNQTK